MAALHSQRIITDLLEAVIRQVALPLEIAKLEGDAVFIFAECREGADWAPSSRPSIPDWPNGSTLWPVPAAPAGISTGCA